mmetsp:Transcript_3161/g.6817  ORF Transcript_3161/g.6817 Transcript_3161/m.6817 type:complete len:202 (-) Transcript_3161:161-766(-)
MTGSYKAEDLNRGSRNLNSCLPPRNSTLGYPAGIFTHTPSAYTSSESSSVTLFPVFVFVASVKRFSPLGNDASAEPLISIPNSRNAPVSPEQGLAFWPEQNGQELTCTENLTVPPATTQLSFAVGVITPLFKKMNVVTCSSDDSTSVVRKSIASAFTPYSPVLRGVSLMVKSTEAKVSRLCLRELAPVLATWLPLASSSLM